jgi:UDP-N-acetylmuramoylalanine-D-glutamate ligase
VFEGIIYSTESVTSGVDKQCDVVVKAPTTDITISNAVTYSHSATSTITAISPAFGSSAGGDTVTITGTNFGSSITVTIDGVNCPISSQTST